MPALARSKCATPDLGTTTGRRQVTESLLPTIRAMAYRLHANLPPWVDRDDLVQAGVVGLYGAMRTYNPAKSDNFRLYAAFRVRGAMLDFLREQDTVSRAERKRLRNSETERQNTCISIEELPAPETYDPHLLAGHAESHRYIGAALENLRPNHRRVIELYYFAGLTMREVGTQLGVNESRISQLHAVAIKRLRELMTAPQAASY